MVHAKTHAFQVLMAVALFCCLWFGSSGRVRAEEKEVYSYNIVHQKTMINTNTNVKSVTVTTASFESEKEVIFYAVGDEANTNVNIFSVYYYNDSLEPFYFNIQYVESVGGVDYPGTGKTNTLQIALPSSDWVYSFVYSTNIKVFKDYDSALLYFRIGDDSGQINKDDNLPIWSNAQYKPTLALSDFTAMIQDNTDLVTTWNGVDHLSSGLTNNKGIDNYENTYVRVELGFAPYGMPGASVKTSQKWDTVYSIKDNGFTIPLADMDIPGSSDTFPDGFQLNWVKATPYYYANDDISGQLYVGVSSVVFFDADGNASNTVQQAPTDSYDDEDPEQSIWQTIANFFGGFYKNITEMFYNLVVPDSAELMTLFQEINDWFSDRLGFIWYPFDLALQLVDALANGEANGMFKVPGLTLNMFDGVTLWNEFDVEIDQFGIFKYVRYFTSVLLVCGVAHMAIDKWDEWIGGHNI